ncbi:MAG TPA: sugar transferase [Puia sp.]|nr:sugar transferase [Puia sp.]
MIKNTSLIGFSFENHEIVDKQKRHRAYIDEKEYFFFFKRFFDIILSVFFLIAVMSWLTPLVAVFIKLTSKGSVFFLQKRAGRGCRIFTCFKFRTMIVNDEADYMQASDNDIRITRVGKFLRKTNIDELPQLLNVLLGDMSIIGPRPHMLSECSKFSTIIPDYKFRAMVRPGLTGMAQVKGFHGPTPDFENIFRRYQWDAFYVRNTNFWLDFRIFYKTITQRIGSLVMYFF